MVQSDKAHWEEKYQDSRFFLKWPDEIVVRFLARVMSGRPGGMVLDLGCGSGRHAELFAQEGYTVYGCDLSENSLGIAKNRLQSKQLSARFSNSLSSVLPYKPNVFDFVVACHSIYYNPHENVVRSIGEIYRVLKSGGWALVTLLADGDLRKTRGSTRDGKTYIGTPETKDHDGVMYSVTDTPAEIQEIFVGGFETVSVGYDEKSFNLNSRTCHWVVTARKG